MICKYNYILLLSSKKPINQILILIYKCEVFIICFERRETSPTHVAKSLGGFRCQKQLRCAMLRPSCNLEARRGTSRLHDRGHAQDY